MVSRWWRDCEYWGLELTVSLGHGRCGSAAAVTGLVRGDDDFGVVGYQAVLKDRGRICLGDAVGGDVT